MKQGMIHVSNEQLLAKLDEIITLAKQINRESALFHKDHNHKNQKAHYEQKVC